MKNKDIVKGYDIARKEAQENLAEKIKEIETLCTHFPVRESDEFDLGRSSMKREVLEILNK